MSSGSSSNLSLKERMISAGVGSLLTSMILTPMDVVRIRLQQQEIIPDCSCVVDSPKSKLSAPVGVNGTVFWQDSCFKDINCKNSSVRYSGTMDAFRKIIQTEGVSTLWRGITVTLLMAIPANVVYFTGYEYLRDLSPLNKTSPSLNPLFCGAFARIFAASTVAPFELVKTRLQSIPKYDKSTASWHIFKDLMQETKKEISSGGYKVLFRGLEITLWRDVPFSAIYWGSYEFIKKHFWGVRDDLLYIENQSNWNHFVNSFLSGCISGATAAIFTHPFDVGKTRWQISVMSNNEKSTLPVRNSNDLGKNMFKSLNLIRQNEGIGALYTGLFARIAKIAPSCAIMISSYEISKRLFSS